MSGSRRRVENRESATVYSPSWEASADLIVAGTGVAGLTAALRARELGLRVLVVTKASLTESNTRLAQGGLAVVLDDGAYDGTDADSIERHVADTVAAGGGLCEADVVRSILARGPSSVARLRRYGAVFDTAAAPGDGLARTREGGHSAFRVIHAGGDATGAEVERALAEQAQRLRIPVLDGHIAVDALLAPSGAAAGLLVLDPHGAAGVVRAPAVLLATGGFGQLYQSSSNPAIATGDGLALAMRAGATATDLEFVQFHPTVLYTAGARGSRPLITEAVRGEGAVLVDGSGAPVMDGQHPLGDLAPRDVVSAAVTRRAAQAPGGIDDHVFLDATRIDDVATRFPTVTNSCARAGVDPQREPIPVAPAAHFACGGVLTSPHGRTDVPGLYAVGEVARTGLHGANRLASNSLLEGLVLGERAAEAVAQDRERGAARAALSALRNAGRGQVPASRCSDRESMQRAMSRHAAIGRNAAGLATLATHLSTAAIDRALEGHEAVEDAALTLIARALCLAAHARAETRGAHVRTDFGERDDRRWQRSQHVTLDAAGDPVLTEPRQAKGIA